MRISGELWSCMKIIHTYFEYFCSPLANPHLHTLNLNLCVYLYIYTCAYSRIYILFQYRNKKCLSIICVCVCTTVVFPLWRSEIIEMHKVLFDIKTMLSMCLSISMYPISSTSFKKHPRPLVLPSPPDLQ